MKNYRSQTCVFRNYNTVNDHCKPLKELIRKLKLKKENLTDEGWFGCGVNDGRRDWRIKTLPRRWPPCSPSTTSSSPDLLAPLLSLSPIPFSFSLYLSHHCFTSVPLHCLTSHQCLDLQKNNWHERVRLRRQWWENEIEKKMTHFSEFEIQNRR